jgi:hypothetical protein
VERASQSHKSSRPDDTGDDQSAAPRETGRSDHAKETSEITDDLLDHIDEVMKETLGLDSDATDEEYEKLAAERMKQYVQKGGQ